MGCSVMSCKYNNSMYAEPPEVEYSFSRLEQILLSDDYESQEMLDARLNEAYNELYVLSETEMLEFARAGDEYYGD